MDLEEPSGSSVATVSWGAKIGTQAVCLKAPLPLLLAAFWDVVQETMEKQQHLGWS